MAENDSGGPARNAPVASRMGRLAAWPVVIGLVLLAPTLFESYQMSTLTTCATYLITAIGFNIVFGYAGTISFGHGAFSLLGAYTVALGQYHWGWPLWFGAVVAIVLCPVVAGVAALPTLRMAPFAIAVITLLYLPALNSAIQYFRSFTLGGDGVPAEAADLSNTNEWYLVAGLAVAAWIICRNLIRSPFGRAWELTRVAPELAASLSIRTTAVRLGAVAISAALAGLTGALWPIRNGFTGPETFQLNYAILILVIVVIGGQATINGPVAGTVVVAVLTLGLSEVFTSGGTASDVVYAIAVLAVVLLAPGGVIQLLRRLTNLLPGRRPRGSSADAPTSVNERASTRSIEEAIETMMPAVDPAVLRVDEVAWSVGGVYLLDDVALDVRPGRVHGLIGPNGAGKTSLLNVICGYLQPSNGTIVLDDKEVRGAPAERSRLGIARTFQQPALLEDSSVLDNVVPSLDARLRARWFDYVLRLPRASRCEAETSETAHRWLEVTGLAGLDDVPAANLSPGQRRQLELARALATGPRVLLLDEPAAGLTSSELDVVERIIMAVTRRGVAVVLIEHHFELVRRVCDEVTVLDAGEVIFVGSPSGAAVDPRVVEAYLGAPTHDTADGER